MQMYLVTREFVSGNLKGQRYQEVTSVRFQVGKTYRPCAGGSSYVIIDCIKV